MIRAMLMALLISGCATHTKTEEPGSLVCESLCDGCAECTMRCELTVTGKNTKNVEVDNVLP